MQITTGGGDMTGADEAIPPHPDTPPTKRIGALSGNTKGITTAAETTDDAHAESVPPTETPPPLPHVGELTSASEDAIVDPSEAILEHIDLDSWKWPEYFAFALTRMEEIFPIGGIPRGIGPVREFVTEDNDFRPLPIDREKWAGADESWTTVGDVLADTFTDAWLVTRNGVALAEEYAWPMKPARQHMLFSVSKSIVSTVIGALADAGRLSPDDLVTTHVPALAESGYAGASIRDLLDMRSGIKFSEEYLEKGSEIRALFEAVDFAPRTPASANGIKSFLTSLKSDREHGSAFVYRSCETDVLAWIAEAVTGQPFSVVTSEYVWSKIGAAHAAQVCQDRWGGSIADGAISTTLRDLARFGEMIARGGTTVDGERVLSAAWIDDIFTGAADSAQVFAASPSGRSYPGGMYRSQFWLASASRDVAIGIGIHGQMLYIDRAAQTVGVKLSSDPEPVSLAQQHGTLAIFEAIAEAVPVTANTPSSGAGSGAGSASPAVVPSAAPQGPSIGTPETAEAEDRAAAGAQAEGAPEAGVLADGLPVTALPAEPIQAAGPQTAGPQAAAAPNLGGAPLIAQNTLY
ncbi:serine hydrolase domain-containing protein [Brevibacterium sp. GP-SGM9]|uniref:serine hydrolase domain-containing protein n=1 Tax=Brevibacterium sp. GP-SGM9 TaxID=3376990 RepID=UPI0039A6F648